MSDSELAGAVPGLEVREKIGSGGMGAVYKAYQPALDRVVALKTVRPEFLTPDGLARFRGEARLLARCTHPNIVRVLAFHPEAPAPYFLMEYIDGIPLDQALKGRPWNEKARLFQEVVATVTSAHDQGVVHGDLKPGNILVDRQSRPHVLDFGLARLAQGDGPPSGDVSGTPNYLAPEVYDGAPTSALTDVYALGVTLYYLLTGLLPWKTLADARAGRAKLPVELDPDVPEPLQRICLKAMERRPEDRYQTAEQLQRDLERFLAGKPVFVRPTRYLEELDRRVENHLRDMALWEREGFVTRRERDAVVRSYQALLGGDSPWLSETRTLVTGTMLVRVGSWCLLLSSLLWPVFYWDRLSEAARVVATGVPALLMVALGISYMARRERRYALACLGSAVLLVLVFEVTLMAEYRWLEYRQPSQWELFSERPDAPDDPNLPGDPEADGTPPAGKLPSDDEVDPAEPAREADRVEARPGGRAAAPPGPEGNHAKGWWPGRPRPKAEPGREGPKEPPGPPRDWGSRGQFLLSNSQLFFAALTAVLCLAALLAGLRAPFFAPWLAVAGLALFTTVLLLVGDRERLFRDKVAWVAVHFLGFVPVGYLVGFTTERRAGPRVARPFYAVAALVGVSAAVALAGFGTKEWYREEWEFHSTTWNLWIAAYSVPFLAWAWLTERYGSEGQRTLTWWLYLLVPVFLLFPLQVLFAKGPTLFSVGGQPLHLYAALYLVACAGLLVLGRLLHLELFLVAGLWGSAVWVFRMGYRHFWEHEGWALAVALTGVLIVALGVWQSRRAGPVADAKPPRPAGRPEAGPAPSSAEPVETVALPT